MKFEEMVLRRESCRAYQNKSVSREDLMKICEAGRLSPSGCNAQPWKFIVVDEPEAKAKLCDALVVEGGLTGAPWREQCPAFIVLVEQTAKVMPAILTYYKNTQRFAQGDIGIACMNMCYQAMDLGLSTCMLGMNDQKKMEEYFGIPEGSEVRLVLAVGYAAEEKEPRAKVRKSFDEVVCFNHWK
ncbi:MAG: nitroreductase family protein [Oscillospiraceae bacterium]|nr:nitroreductase family protein [Oscillospiraceae bacterium]